MRNSARHCFKRWDPCPLMAVNTKPHGISPRFAKCHVWDFYCCARLLCGFVVAAFSGRGRRSGREVYFCQPVISDPSNYTLINQAWRPDGCGPLQLQSLVIPHVHLFNFSPNSVLSPWFFGRKDIDGFDQLRGNAETHGTFRPHGRELLVQCSQTSSDFDRSWGALELDHNVRVLEQCRL